MLLKRPSAILGTSMLDRLGSSSLSVAQRFWRGRWAQWIRPARESKQTDYTGERVLCGLTDGTANRYIDLMQPYEQKKHQISRLLTDERNKTECVSDQNKVALRLVYFWNSRRKARSVSKEGSGDSFGLEFLLLTGFELALWSFSHTFIGGNTALKVDMSLASLNHSLLF